MIVKMMQKKYEFTPRELELAEMAEELLKQAEAHYKIDEMEIVLEEDTTWK